MRELNRDTLGRMLFEYEVQHHPPEQQMAWDALEEWKREAWRVEAVDLLARFD